MIDAHLGPDCPRGVDIAAQLDDAGFRRAGVICICTAACEAERAAMSGSHCPGVDFVVAKGKTARVADDVYGLLAKRRAAAPLDHATPRTADE